jgi:methylglyoxal synthase
MKPIISETIEEEKLNYTIFHWGPLLFRTKIKPNDIKALRELCDEGNEVWSDNLAGIIKGEYKIDSELILKL